MKVDTKEYYIAYFDILGYKVFFEDKDNDINEFLNFNIKLVDDIIKKTMHNTIVYNYPFTLKMFSDNFVILLEKSESISEYNMVRVLSYLLAMLQLNFLEKYKILVRGVITKGDAYVDDKLIFGEGLIRAVEMECYANFPRIILDKERIDIKVCENLRQEYVIKDEDDEYYINFFGIIGNGIGFNNELIENEENRIETLRKNIISLVKRYGKYNRNVKNKTKIEIADRTISKYAWLLSKFNEFCELKYTSFKIPYKLTLYYRLMKCEIDI